MIILHDQILKTASSIVSIPEPDPRTKLELLHSLQLAKYVIWSVTTGTIRITIDFPEDVQVDTVGIAGHNFSANTTVSVNGDTPVTLEPIHGLIECTPTLDSEHVIEIYDPLATGGASRLIGRLELGELYHPPVINDQLVASEVSNSVLSLSSSRQAYGYRRTTYTRGTIQFPIVESDEAFELLAFYQDVDIFVPFFIAFDEDCILAKTNYAILEETETLPLNYQYSREAESANHYWTSSLTFSEVY